MGEFHHRGEPPLYAPFLALPAADFAALLAERNALRALLGEARDLMNYVGCQDCLADDPLLTGSWDRCKAALDAALRGKEDA